MSAKERKAFKVIYGEARAQEEIYEIMAELLLSSKALGTITGYVAAIEKWVKFARKAIHLLYDVVSVRLLFNAEIVIV